MKLENFSERLKTGIKLANISKLAFAKKSICQVDFLNRFLDGTNINPTNSNMLRFSRTLGTRPYFFYRPYQENSFLLETVHDHYLYESWHEIKKYGVELPEFVIGETTPFPILLEHCALLYKKGAISQEIALNLLGITQSEFRKQAKRLLKENAA